MDYDNKQPFYLTYPMPDDMRWNDVDEKDADYLKRMYPSTVREIQKMIEDECDKLEYEGSVMFDEYPDTLTIRSIANKVYSSFNEDELKGAVSASQFIPGYGVSYPYPHRRGVNWLNDLVQILLINEMFKRRCRYRGCYGWW